LLFKVCEVDCVFHDVYFRLYSSNWGLMMVLDITGCDVSHCLEILLTPRTPYGNGQGSQMVLNDSHRRGTPTPRVVYDGGT